MDPINTLYESLTSKGESHNKSMTHTFSKTMTKTEPPKIYKDILRVQINDNG